MRPTLLSLLLSGPFFCAATMAAHAQAPAPAPTPDCQAATYSKLPMLKSRRLADGKNTEFYGRYKMALTSGSPDCHFRQLLLTTQHLNADLPAYNGNGPTITIIIRRGSFRRRVTDMRVYQVFTTVDNNPKVTEYTINAESQSAAKSAYYADISIIGFPTDPNAPDPCVCPPQCPDCCKITSTTPPKPPSPSR